MCSSSIHHKHIYARHSVRKRAPRDMTVFMCVTWHIHAWTICVALANFSIVFFLGGVRAKIAIGPKWNERKWHRCVLGCRNIHMIPCSRIHQTFWHPTHSILGRSAVECVLGVLVGFRCVLWCRNIHMIPCSRIHQTFWHPTHSILWQSSVECV